MKETEENYIRRKCLERLKDNPEAGVMDFQEGIYAGIEYDKNKYSEEDMRKAIDFMPYHLEYGNIVARKSDKDIENFIEQIKKK